MCNVRCSKNTALFCGGNNLGEVSLCLVFFPGSRIFCSENFSTLLSISHFINSFLLYFSESIYETGSLLPGPVVNPQLEITSDTVMVMRWEKPVTGTKVDQYKILAVPIKTYSSFPLQTVTWTAQNDRQRFEMLNLHPATIYNVTITSLSASREEGGSISVKGQTEVGCKTLNLNFTFRNYN